MIFIISELQLLKNINKNVNKIIVSSKKHIIIERSSIKSNNYLRDILFILFIKILMDFNNSKMGTP